MSRVHCCEVCDTPDARWSVTRIGDVVTTWACDAHLGEVSGRLQRDHEVTEHVVRDALKAREWAGITRALDKIADGP